MKNQLGCKLRGELTKSRRNSFFSRSSFGCSSPDIVPLGVSELPDPSGRLLAEFNGDPSQAIVPGGVNQIYLRGIYADQLDKSYTASVFHGDGSLIVWPETLKGRACTSGDGFTEIPLKPNYQGSRFSLQTPFLYNAPVRNQPVSFFTEIYGNNTLGSERQAWSRQSVSSINDVAEKAFLKLVNSASRNVSTVPTQRPEEEFRMPFYSGSTDETMVFNIRCENVATGWTVSLDFVPDGKGDIENWIPPTPVKDSEFFGVYVEKFIQAETSGTAVLSYCSNGIRPIPGWSITVDAILLVDPMQRAFAHSIKADHVLSDLSGLSRPETSRVLPIGGGRLAAPTREGLQQPSLGFAQPVSF